MGLNEEYYKENFPLQIPNTLSSHIITAIITTTFNMDFMDEAMGI
jgi:hypothetical protein